MKLAILSLLAGSAAAFNAPTTSLSTSASAIQKTSLSESKADLEVLAKKLNPVIGYYDPLRLADAEFWGQSNEATIGFIRHAEIKHGRIAMFAFVGYIAVANSFRFPWPMQMDGSGFLTETNPPAAWDAVTDDAKWQIFSLIAFLEVWSELSTPGNKHYMRGGRPGDFPDFTSGPEGLPHPVPFNFYDPFRLSKNMTDEQKEKRLLVEINNGRLAMLGIIGFVSEQVVPGSVPGLTGVVPAYDGDVMAPFTTNYLGAAFGQ